MIRTHTLLLGISGATLALAGLGHGTSTGTTGSGEPGSTPQPQATRAPEAGLAWGDVDGDGRADALVVGADARARLMLNFGQGRFEDVTEAAGLDALAGATCALVADLDGDGHDDLYLGSSATRVWRNLGDGTFEPVTSGIEHDLVDLAVRPLDHDGDGRPDLQVHTEAGDLVYRNLWEGRFERLDLPLAPAPLHVGWTAPASVDGPGAESAHGTATPAQRRLGRWIAGRGPGGSLPSAVAGPVASGSSSATLPLAPTCVSAVSDSSGGGCIGASSVPMLGKLYPLSNDLFVTPAGFVGLGTQSPTNRLTVADGSLEVQVPVSAQLPLGSRIALSTPGGDVGVMIQRGNGAGGAAQRWDIKTDGSNTLRITDVVTAGSPDRMLIGATGDVGIGTSPVPGKKLTAQGTIFADLDNVGGLPSGSEVGMSSPNGEPGITITRGNGSGGVSSRWDISVRGTSFGIRDNANGFQDRLTIDSAGLVSVKRSLEIRGGADIVERFESSCGVLEPGTVVAIDPENPGQLACSFDAYDTKVAGVVSGAGGVKPGLCLGQDGVLDGDTQVAMTGRVYVKCSTENGAIRAGDRLTTAALAGHAMKATDAARADGAVIGKAMSALDEGTGLVLVLVNLQ